MVYILDRIVNYKIKMKVLIVFAFALFAVNALTVQEQWTQFKIKHTKNYQNIDEEKYRYEIFQNNLKTINEHNAKYAAGLKSYTMAVNQFADMTPKEFGDLLRLVNGPRPIISGNVHIQNLSIPVPNSIDWREHNAVLRVKNQGNCASCWSFSATGAIEGQNAIRNKKIVSLSEQELLDCSGSYGNGDCIDGGLMISAFEYVIDNGIDSENDYPYEAVQRRCRASRNPVVKIKSFARVTQNEYALKEAVGTVGPISVAIYSIPIQFYSKGIFEEPYCYNELSYLDHGVLAVGYGIENGKKYWILKNSWSSNWGEDGYLRLAKDKNQCGVALDASYPIL